jgi:hypothetical protein
VVVPVISVGSISILLNQARTEMRRIKLPILRKAAQGGFPHPRAIPSSRQSIEKYAHSAAAVEALLSAYQPVFRLRAMQDLTTAETGAARLDRRLCENPSLSNKEHTAKQTQIG